MVRFLHVFLLSECLSFRDFHIRDAAAGPWGFVPEQLLGFLLFALFAILVVLNSR